MFDGLADVFEDCRTRSVALPGKLASPAEGKMSEICNSLSDTLAACPKMNYKYRTYV